MHPSVSYVPAKNLVAELSMLGHRTIFLQKRTTAHVQNVLQIGVEKDCGSQNNIIAMV